MKQGLSSEELASPCGVQSINTFETDSERIMPEETQFAMRSTRGESVPNEKRSFSQNHQLASQAGRKGGQSVDPEKRSFSQNHGLAAQAGRKGGHASHGGTRTLKPDH